MPNINYDIDEDFGWLDSGSYADYTKIVRRVIETLAKTTPRPTFGDIKRELGERYIERFNLATALRTLEAQGHIECVCDVNPTRWMPKTLTPRPKYEYSRGPGLPTDKVRPFSESIVGERW